MVQKLTKLALLCVVFGILTAALISGCSAGGLTWVPTAAETSTLAHSPTLIPTMTPTPIPVFTLSGTVFFDYNGSGEQDLVYSMDAEGPVEEPGIPGVQICLDTQSDSQSCRISDQNGFYSFEDVPAGILRMLIESPTDDPATAFRYINISHGWVDIPAYEMNAVQVPAQHLPDTEIQPICKFIPIDFGEDMDYDIPLMQGFLTLPFPRGFPAYILGYFDIDGNADGIQNGSSMNYLGDTYNWTRGYPLAATTSNEIDLVSLAYPGISGTQDGHAGIDYRLDDLTPVLAPLEGVVFAIYWENGQNIKVVHDQFGGEQYMTFLGHLDTRIIVDEGQRVYRGQIVGLSGHSGEGNTYFGSPIPVLHWGFVVWPDKGDVVDPYRNVAANPSLLASERSYWIMDNTPFALSLRINDDQLKIH